MSNQQAVSKRSRNLMILVAALGYFVDIYDLVLFSIVRIPSLKAIGIDETQMLDVGVKLIDYQMAGMLLGGILWGILGDKKGRLSVLFASILMYSVANILNGMVESVEAYAVLRFIAGLGLAGELGAGITLVSEIMDKDSRGWGTTIVATIGVSGAVAAALVGEYFDWRMAYYIGGVMGLLLLLMRVGVHESGMFKNLKDSGLKKGQFLSLITHPVRAKRYFSIIAIAIPVWYVVGILVTFSPEVTKSMGLSIKPDPGKNIMFSYMGITLGDLLSGFLSQRMRSRKKVLAIFLLSTVLMCVVFFTCVGESLNGFYTICFFLGLATGYWAVFMTSTAEQFGTNIRATATTTAPNFVRGALIPMTFSFMLLKQSIGILPAAILVGVVTLSIAFWGLSGIQETYGKDLDFYDHD